MATDVDAKLLRQTKFPQEFNQKVDMKKVNLEVMKKWIAGKISEILGSEDDVVIELCFGLLEGSRFPDIKRLQIQLTGFLDKDTAKFCKELWSLCLSAQSNPQGVPKELLEAKKLELLQEKLTPTDRLTRRKLPKKRAENASKRKHESEKSRVYGSENVEIVVAELMIAAVGVEVESLHAVGPGALVLPLDVARLIIAARHPVVRWILTSLRAVEVEDATETAGPTGIVHREIARYLFPGLAPALAHALAPDLQHPLYAAEEAMMNQDLGEIGLGHGLRDILDVFPVPEAEGEEFQVVVIHGHAPFLLKRLAHVHLEDPGDSGLPHSHPAAVLPLLQDTSAVVEKNTIDADVLPNLGQDLVL